MRSAALFEDTNTSCLPIERRLGWRTAYRANFARYHTIRRETSALKPLLAEQVARALSRFRIASGLCRLQLLAALKCPGLMLPGTAQKLTKILTSISPSYQAGIVHGIYILHLGDIIILDDVVIGQPYNLSQGVTNGSSGRWAAKGTPLSGHRVYLATNAVVAANLWATCGVPAWTTVLKVPAEVVGHRDSGA